MKNITSRKLLLVLLTLLCVKLSFGQENKRKTETWRSITPLVSTMPQVEKAVGLPMSKSGFIHIYDTADARITIWYGGVKPGENRCKLDVSDDTVLDVIVSPKKRPLLSELGFDLSKFKKEATLNDEVWNYVDEEKGILIHTYDDPDSIDKVVIYLKFSPTAKDEKEKCLPKRGASLTCT